jgi:hypothetical protein
MLYLKHEKPIKKRMRKRAIVDMKFGFNDIKFEKMINKKDRVYHWLISGFGELRIREDKCGLNLFTLNEYGVNLFFGCRSRSSQLIGDVKFDGDHIAVESIVLNQDDEVS